MAAAPTGLRPLFLLPSPSLLPASARFLSPVSLPRRLLPSQPLRATLLRSPRSSSRRLSPVLAAQSSLFKVIQTAWRIGRDVTEAGANLVPDAVPRPIARIGVATVALTVALFLLKSIISTAFFVLAVMGLVYFAFVSMNTEEVSRSNDTATSTEEETLEEARRIMEKYK